MTVLLATRSFWKILVLHPQLLSAAVDSPGAAASGRAHGLQSQINNGIREMSRCSERTASEGKNARGAEGER